MSFKNNMRYEVPAVVILSTWLSHCLYRFLTSFLGDRCLHTFTKPPHPYSVMDHFKPIYLWYEKNLGHLTARFRWERLNLDGKAWWASQDCPTRSGPPDYNTKAERQVCPSCHQTHPRIYQEGFICVNHKCSDFWKLNGEVIASKATLTYSHVWLEERTEWSSPVRPPFALRPKALPMDDAQDPFYTTMRAAMKGIVCPQCGSCIPRKRMDGWFCNTTNCGYVCRLPRMNLNIRSVELAYGSQFQGHPIPYHVFSDPISRRRTTYHGPWRIETFGVLEGCFVKHFHSNELINARPGGANDMFKQMSDPALGLERRPMGASKGMSILDMRRPALTRTQSTTPSRDTSRTTS